MDILGWSFLAFVIGAGAWRLARKNDQPAAFPATPQETSSGPYEELWSTTVPEEVEFVKELLDSVEIPYRIEGNPSSSFSPSPARFLVPEDRFDEARDYIEDIARKG